MQCLQKKCGNAPKKLTILNQVRTHFQAKREKGVGTPFVPHYIPVYATTQRPKYSYSFTVTLPAQGEQHFIIMFVESSSKALLLNALSNVDLLRLFLFGSQHASIATTAAVFKAADEFLK